MENLIYGCCGLNCEECPVFIATVNDDDALRQKTADEWSKLYSKYIGKDELKVEDMNCDGCQSDGDLLFIGCRNCPIRACCREKQLSTCASCHNYKSCEMLNGFFGYAPQARENLERIRDSLH